MLTIQSMELGLGLYRFPLEINRSDLSVSYVKILIISIFFIRSKIPREFNLNNEELLKPNKTIPADDARRNFYDINELKNSEVGNSS